jgi:hydroxymethylpyrimidine kinase/phosphomethylpyrimidine kinase
MVANVLTIAGSDPSGGAGIQADLKTFAAQGCYGMAVVAALTVQNTQGVQAIHLPPPDFVAAQIDAIFADIDVAAVKVGMLGSAANVAAVAARLVAHGARNIVVDPVLAATTGDSLAGRDVVAALRAHLCPAAALVTPNLAEAAALAGTDVPRGAADMQAVAERLCAGGMRAVLVKGGHLDGPTAEDILFDGVDFHHFAGPRLPSTNTHGTGCTLSAAIAAGLAKGLALPAAIEAAKAYVSAAIAAADRLHVGRGAGPLHHGYALRSPGGGED